MPGPQQTGPTSSPGGDPQLLLDPLGYLRTEIYRQRVACNTLEALASSGANGDIHADADRMLRYINQDLPLHIADLEESLFPLLDRLAAPSDGRDGMLARYRSERGCDDEPLHRLIASLGRVAAGGAAPVDLQPDAESLVTARRRDLAWVNDVVLPLAERLITGADLVTLGKAMADRRGVPYPR